MKYFFPLLFLLSCINSALSSTESCEGCQLDFLNCYQSTSTEQCQCISSYGKCLDDENCWEVNVKQDLMKMCKDYKCTCDQCFWISCSTASSLIIEMFGVVSGIFLVFILL